MFPKSKPKSKWEKKKTSPPHQSSNPTKYTHLHSSYEYSFGGLQMKLQQAQLVNLITNNSSKRPDSKVPDLRGATELQPLLRVKKSIILPYYAYNN